MWSEQLANGKIKYVERYKDPLTLKDKKVSITLSGKNTAANRKKALEELQRKIDKQNSVVKQNNYTLKQIKDEYIIYQKSLIKLSTVNRNDTLLDRILRLLNQDAIVDNLSANYITKQLLASKKNTTTLNEYIKRLKAMLRWAYDNNYINNSDLIQRLKPFPTQTKNHDIQEKFLEPEELKNLLNYMLDKNMLHWYYLSNFLALTGMRVGEVIALEDSDVDSEYIHINKTYDVHNDIVTTAKTNSSMRDIYIQAELTKLIHQIRLFVKESGMANGYRSFLFFPDIRNGQYINYYSYERWLHDTSLSVLGRAITPHVLRHTHASLLLAQGVPIDTISRRLGHENSKVTKEIYLHVTQRLIELDNAAIRDTKIL